MTTVELASGHTVEVQEVLFNTEGDTVYIGNEKSYNSYLLHDIVSIIPPKQKAPTRMQKYFTETLLPRTGYKWDKQHSVAATGVVLKRADGDFWFFGMEGEIMHNPTGITIKL